MASRSADLGALVEAITDVDITKVQRLLRSRPDLNQQADEMLALVEGARVGIEFVNVLLDAGADPNARDANGVTPLLAASETGKVDVVKRLLAGGADVNVHIGVRNAMRAAAKTRSPEHLEVLKALIAAGADVNILSRSKFGTPTGTPLTQASAVGNVEAIHELLASGADLNAVVDTGSALISAAFAGQQNAVKMLLEAGANRDFKVPGELGSDKMSGKTAAELATQAGHRRIAEMILQYGGAKPQASRSTNLAEAWQRLEKVLARSNKPALRALRPAATAKDLKALAAELARPLPPEAEAFFKTHDGQEDVPGSAFIKTGDPLYAKFHFQPIAGVLDEWRMWKKLLAGGEFKGQSVLSDTGVRAEWYNPGWIPLTGDGLGNSHCLDLAPAAGGKPGQIILLWHDETSRPLVAGSLAEWLNDLAEK